MLHPNEEIMRELIQYQWTKDSIYAAVIDPEHRGKEDNWSFVSCKNMLARGKYLHQTILVENFLIDEIKDYFH